MADYRSVKEIWTGYKGTGPEDGRTFYPQLAGETLFIKLSNGEKLDINFYENPDGTISISGYDILIRPAASNTIHVGSDRPNYRKS